MAAWRYEISLLVLKNISLVCCAYLEIFFNTREKFRISARSCNILYFFKVLSCVASVLWTFDVIIDHIPPPLVDNCENLFVYIVLNSLQFFI